LLIRHAAVDRPRISAVEDAVTLMIQFDQLLQKVSDERAPIDDVEEWYQRNRDALRSCDDALLKSAVQRALVYTWSLRTGLTVESDARASLSALAGRLQPSRP
jgi:hypothetical protein